MFVITVITITMRSMMFVIIKMCVDKLPSHPVLHYPTQPALVAPLTGWTVGLIATFTSAACVVAADTGAYFVGEPKSEIYES